MPLGTNSDVDEIEAVKDRNGDRRPPANADQLGNFSGGVDGETTDDTTGSTLPAGEVPEGIEVVVQAKESNASSIKVGLTASPTVALSKGQNASFRVQDTSQINIVAQSAGDGVNFTHEASA